jgi:hypothetical protein
VFPLDGGRVDHSLFIIILFCVRLKDGVVDILRTREGRVCMGNETVACHEKRVGRERGKRERDGG